VETVCRHHAIQVNHSEIRCSNSGKQSLVVMPVLSNVDQVGEKGLIRYSPGVPKRAEYGNLSYY
jgi:hypothetical protein